MTPYYVNISSILDFMQCRFRWLCKWVENRVPRDEAHPLAYGKMFHKIMEYHAKGHSMETALSMVETELLESNPNSDLYADLHAMKEPMLLWKDSYEFEIPVLEAEEPYEFPHPLNPSVIMRIRPDRVGIRNGKMNHVQHKALAASKNFGTYIELSKRSYHEHIYAEGMVLKYPQYEYAGTMFNLFRKLQYRGKATKANPEGTILHQPSELFFQHFMNIDRNSQLHKHILTCILSHVQGMIQTEEEYKDEGIIPPPNESMNDGFYHNSIDLYYRVLIGEIQLSDDTYFKDREELYRVTETN